MGRFRIVGALAFSLLLTASCADPHGASERASEEAAPPARPPTYAAKYYPWEHSPGTTVLLTGTTVRGEDGRWAPADRLEAWWNTSVPSTESKAGRRIKGGPVLKLAQVDDMERCSLATEFIIPDVEPGTYEISVFVWDDPPSEGYGSFLPHRFTVTEG